MSIARAPHSLRFARRIRRFTEKLDNPADWEELEAGPRRAVLVAFKHWGEDMDLNVLNPDGTISPPKFVLTTIEGQEVEVPGAPLPGNPGADEMLKLVLQRDLARAREAILRHADGAVPHRTAERARPRRGLVDAGSTAARAAVVTRRWWLVDGA